MPCAISFVALIGAANGWLAKMTNSWRVLSLNVAEVPKYTMNSPVHIDARSIVMQDFKSDRTCPAAKGSEREGPGHIYHLSLNMPCQKYPTSQICHWQQCPYRI
jgi:hypothetical protein